MNTHHQRPLWKWHEKAVDPEHDHFELRYGSAANSRWDAWLPIALGRPVGGIFPVQFLIDLSDKRQAHFLQDVIGELNFYLVEKGEADPWGYAQYHCGTSANVYSAVHWSFFPAMTTGGKRPKKMRDTI